MYKIRHADRHVPRRRRVAASAAVLTAALGMAIARPSAASSAAPSPQRPGAAFAADPTAVDPTVVDLAGVERVDSVRTALAAAWRSRPTNPPAAGETDTTGRTGPTASASSRATAAQGGPSAGHDGPGAHQGGGATSGTDRPGDRGSQPPGTNPTDPGPTSHGPAGPDGAEPGDSGSTGSGSGAGLPPLNQSDPPAAFPAQAPADPGPAPTGASGTGASGASGAGPRRSAAGAPIGGPGDQLRAGGLDRTPANGSQPRQDAYQNLGPASGPDLLGAPDDGDSGMIPARWAAYLPARELGIPIFIAGLIGLIIAISGLVTVALRRRP